MPEEYHYEPLDFSSIMGEKFAVHCQTQEDARHFCAEIKRQFGRAFWATDSEPELPTHWIEYGERTAYSPYLNRPKGGHMTYCSVNHYIRKGFAIVPFIDLLTAPELGEIKIDEVNISALLG